MRKSKVLPEFPKYANHHGWSDITPYEVVKVISAKTLEIRPMRAEVIKVDLKFEIGGFAGHCTNQEDQKWNITSIPEAETFRIRLTKTGWRSASHGKFRLSNEPVKFYDYNF